MIAAFITGQSVRGCCGLSEAQRDFQRRTDIPPERWLPWNFPYRETAPFPEAVPIVRASLNNFSHYLGSRRPRFREEHHAEIASAFAPHDAVVLFAGSCGLELLANLELAPEIRAKIHVFACGPVSRGIPETATTMLVQGRRDFLSRMYHRRVDHVIGCGHMGYLEAPETRVLFDEFCRRVVP